MIEPLRETERAVFANPDDIGAELVLLCERLRRGELSRERVEEAARLGHAGARAYTGIADRAEHDLQPGIALLSERERCLLGADFAEHVLPIFERVRPGDARPREAIEAARLFACGLIDQEHLTCAAWWAADAARAADAADAAAAAWAAETAAWWAVETAAWWAAASADDGDAERAYQRALLASYLMGEAKLWTPEAEA